MCAEFKVRSSEKQIEKLLRQTPRNLTGEPGWDRHVRLYGEAPVLRQSDGQLVVENMHFSLLPPGGHIPFTANTRIDDWDPRHGLTLAFQKPTWRTPFLRQRCVVPVTQFLEPIYEGKYAGQMLGFSRTDGEPMWVAGIYQESVDKKTGEIYHGFSLLTDFAHADVLKTGHHRTILMLPPEAALKWMKEDPIDGRAGIRFLLRHKARPHLQAEPVREMKGWKSRVKNAATKNAHEDHIRPRVTEARERLGLS
jgi:putative SOS response-associated peptidase YedK